jgi:AraC-like DNA-binding protein
MSIPLRRSPDLEQIVMDPLESFHWNAHDFPSDLARWNYHPECEIHLIRRSGGTTFVGDYIGPFRPGNLVLVGPNLPHHWESDRQPGEVVHLRDVALHFDPGLVHRGAQTFPEFAEVEPLLKDAARGLQFHGDAAGRGAALLERVGAEAGLQRLLRFLDLLLLLARSGEREPLASVGYLPNLDREAPPLVQKVMHYILANMSAEVRMSEAARLTGMSSPSFCRFFKRNTGNNFVSYVRKLRIGSACKLLVESSLPITDVCYEVGYQNVSNFNRHFRREKGVTPSRYRQQFMHRAPVEAIPPTSAPGEGPLSRRGRPRPGR